jgi:hypothetical protein
MLVPLSSVIYADISHTIFSHAYAISDHPYAIAVPMPHAHAIVMEPTSRSYHAQHEDPIHVTF